MCAMTYERERERKSEYLDELLDLYRVTSERYTHSDYDSERFLAAAERRFLQDMGNGNGEKTHGVSSRLLFQFIGIMIL